jgi:hypothetical protein
MEPGPNRAGADEPLPRFLPCQLRHRDRGDLNANHGAISSKNFAEDWTLDMTGNWPTFKQDTDGNGTWDLNQSRTHDEANEITEITEIAGSSSHVAHDRAANVTSRRLALSILATSGC